MTSSSPQKATKFQIFSWCLYDWGNTVLGTIIFTFIYSVYFARGIVGDETTGSAYWGYAVGFAGLFIAIMGPILGAVSDIIGRRKPILLALTLLAIIPTALLFWMAPDPVYILPTLALVMIATIGYELTQSQYNAMLADIAPADKMGRISGLGWGLGYFGGLTCLVVALVGFIGLGDSGGLFGVSEENSTHVRATALLAAGWYAIFALPLFLFVPDRKTLSHTGSVIRSALKTVWHTIKSLFTVDKNIGRFLVASAIYRDGLNTLFTIGGLYAAGTFGMEFQEILIFAIGLNITAGIGAIALSFIDDKKSAKMTIILSLVALIGLGLGIILVQDKMHFMILALTLGLFIGPVQSSSRTLMARLAPPNVGTEMFGLYAMTGKSIAFTGPLLFGVITQITDSQRWGLSVIIALWLIGLWLVWKVRED